MESKFLQFIQTIQQIANFNIWGLILFGLALSFHILRGKTAFKLSAFTVLRNLALVLGVGFFTGSIKLIGLSDYLWFSIAGVVGLLDGFLESNIIPYKKRAISNIAKFQEWVSRLHIKKRDKLSKIIRQGLYDSYLNLLWHSILILLIIAGIWIVIWTVGVVPYKHTISLILVLFAVNKIREHWWVKWAWADCYVRVPGVFSSLHLPPVTTTTKQRLKHIIKFFYLNLFVLFLFLLFFPKFIGDESGFGLLIQYFGFTGTLLFFSILIFLVFRFLGILAYSQKIEFIWTVGYISLIGVMLSGFIAIFLHLFLNAKATIIGALITASLLLASFIYLSKKRRFALNTVILSSLIFIILFAVEMSPKYESMSLLRTAKKNLEYGLLNEAQQTFKNLTKTTLFNNEIAGSTFIFDAHLGLAETALKMGDYATAKKQLSTMEFKKWLYVSNRHKLQLIMEMAELYRKLGDKISEERMLTKAERMLYPEKKDYENKLVSYAKFLFKIINPHYWKAQIDLHKAQIAIKENRYNQATKLLTNVEKIGEILGSYRLLVETKNTLGNICLAQDKYDEALGNYNQALMLSEKFLDRYTRAICLIKIAAVQNLLAKEAKENLLLAINISKNIGAREILWHGLYQYGVIFEGKEEYQKAISSYKEAIKVVESMRAELKGEKERAGFIGGRLSPYEKLIALLKKMHEINPSQGYHKEALYYAERAKARTLLEALAARGPLARTHEDKDILAREKRLLYKIASLRQKLIKAGGEELKEQLENAEIEYYRFIEEAKLKSPELASLITINPSKPEKIQNLLDSETTLIEYYTTKDKTYVWLITRNSLRIHEIPLGKEKIKKIVNDFLLPNISKYSRRPAPIITDTIGKKAERETTNLERQRNRERFITLCQQVHEELFAPLERDIRTKNLVIVPHGALHKMPFAALNNGNKYLIDKYAISVLPSASVLEFIVKKRNPDKGRLLALANPIADYVLGFYELPHTETEVSRISQYFSKKEVYYRKEATESVVKEKSQGFDVIHLASHGEFNEKQPLFSGLLLARDNKNDGCLHVHEVFGLDLREANLITLSACETALAKIEGGDDLVGLSRGFIYAGTPSILGTLWKVDDPATAQLMEMFYDNWRRKGMNKSKALRKAQIDLKSISGWDHPYYWAPFVMIGDWR